MVDIWERGNTFPPHMLTSFKDKLNAPASNSKLPFLFVSFVLGDLEPVPFASMRRLAWIQTGVALIVTFI